MAGFVSKCGKNHLESILHANMLCNRLGLDTEIIFAPCPRPIIPCWTNIIRQEDGMLKPGGQPGP